MTGDGRRPVARRSTRRSLVGLVGLVGLTVRALPGWAAEPVGNDAQSSPWPVSRAVRLIARHHIARPPLRTLPTERDALIDRLHQLDPQFAILPRRRDEPGGAGGIGVLSIDAPSGRILVPQPGEAAWRAGLRRPIRLAGGADPSAGHIVGTWLDTGGPVEVDVVAGPVDEGAVHRRSLAGWDTLRVFLFVAGRTVGSARWQLSTVGRFAKGVPGSTPPAPLVLDLRYCAGGDVFEATDFGGLWLDGSRSWITLRSAASAAVPLRAGAPGGALHAPPDVVLVSEYTASACEQVVLGLVRHAGSLVLGERTAGKCSVQTIYPLDERHAIRFSTGRWNGPDDMPCDPNGIEPDRRVAGTVHSDADVARALRELGLKRPASPAAPANAPIREHPVDH